MSFANILTQTGMVFVMLIAGYIVRKLEITTDEMISGLSKFVLKFTLPVVIFISLNKEFSWDKLTMSGIVLGVGLIAYIIAILLSKVVASRFDVEKNKQGVYRFLMIFPNTALMGFPMAQAIYGDDGLFYAVVYNILFNVFAWTIGIKMLGESSDDPQIREAAKVKGNPVKQILLNPGMAAAILGALLFISPVKIPPVLAEPLGTIGHMSTPLAMVVVGGILATTNIGSAFKNGRLWVITLFRIVFMPLVIIGVCKLLSVPAVVAGVIALLSGMPTAADAAMFARRYETDYNTASLAVFMTTLFNLITTPAIVFMVIKLFGA
ncbi:putative auxin efflux carrier [Gottschalkia acidurici 9a]|uniref:Auxin efflux carrier n=1 Tax=Gottschalkia acidurici (strain ATCC 7906 / DSM 604 / BCRC 14475 / CIP 104303 / KCTC 5404 / NCIMB 10678 / 9a) TaxID=1128398 RepID=K0AYD7_GOTA9|nr:AEC family transporter [Gottschalkia acidurici]AFS78793.1 putative auxin efflux carrier [Gottschalkia acidurici 9a]